MNTMDSFKIESVKNENFKTWQSLLTSKGIKKHGFFLLSGEKVVRETLEKHPEKISAFIDVADSSFSLFEIPEGLKSFHLAPALFKELDIFGTHTPLLVVQVPELPTWNPAQPPQGLEILCPLGDPSNLGALIRSCAAFSVNKLILLQESGSPFLPKVTRSASGQIWNTPLYRGPSMQELKDELVQTDTNLSLFYLDMHGENLKDFKWPQNCRLLIGEEGPGVPEWIRSNPQNKPLAIPINPRVESLNAAHCASIALYSYSCQR